jgi:predicted nucleotidyltransferase
MSTTAGRTDATDAGAILFGKTRRQLLAWLYGHADERFYLRQLVRQTGAAQGAMQRELAALLRAGLITREVEGRQVYIQANRESPIFADLQRLLLKTAGATDVIRSALTPLAHRIDVAFVYGSAAKGTLRAASDIDLLVVGRVSFGEVVSALGDAQERLGRDINPTVYPAEEFARKLRSGHHFLTTVLTEPKTFIIGTDHELGRLAEERLADRTPDERTRDRRSVRRRRTGSR